MSNHPKPIRPGSPSSASTAKRKGPGSTVIVVAVIVAVGFGIWRWKSQQPTTPPVSATASPAQTEAAVTPPPAVAPATKPDFQKLKGKWLRPDGGYVIEIKSVADNGTMDAGYFNPKPIHVAKAEASQDGTLLKMFIELRDVNYPGSTYTLAYDAAGDQLYGIYYQAVQQQNFDVNFERTQ